MLTHQGFRGIINSLEKAAFSIPDPLRRVLFRNGLIWRLRNALTRTAIAEMASPIKGCRMRLPQFYLRSYGVTPVEPNVVVFAQQTVRPGWIVADIGAFAGYYTLLLARLIGSQGMVHSFEPVPENFELLKFNVQLNVCKNVQINPLAIGPTDSEMVFRRLKARYMPFGSLIPKQDLSRYSGMKIEVRSLDSYLSERGWPHISFAKIDVEAAEAQVVQGMQETIQRFSPILVIELHDGPPHDRDQARRVLPLLFKSGYQIFSLEDDPALQHPLPKPEDWTGHKHCVAVPRSRR